MSRVLVVEDDPHILRVISLWLSGEGHEVLEARDGVAALALFERQQPAVLITDVNMPAMDGLELVERVLRAPRSLRGLVVLTNRWDHDQIRRRQAPAGVHVLPKPFSPSKLSELVRQLATAAPLGAVAGDRPSEV